MLLVKLALNSLRRDWRSGELRLMALALLVATASYTTVAFFTDRVNKATKMQATELLAADLVVASPEPITQQLIDQATALGLQSARSITFRSMIVVGERLELAEVKAVGTAYPLRGRMRISTGLFSPEISTDRIPAAGQVWPDTRLFQLLKLYPDDVVSVGASRLQASKVLTYEPDRGGDMFAIAPRLLMNIADLEATELLVSGSRARHKLLLAGEAAAIDRFRALVTQDPGLTIQGIRDARPELRTALDRAEQFLGLAVLVSVALAGLAIAMSAQRYANRHIDHCALMRCFGIQQHAIAVLYFSQLFILALLFSLLGVMLGFLGQYGLSEIMLTLVATPLPAPSLMPLLYGVLVGIITTTGFAAPQLVSLLKVPPLRVLQRHLEAPRISNRLIYVAAAGALALLIPWQSGNVKMTAYGFAGMVATVVLLFVFARLLIRQLGRLRKRLGIAIKFGLANIARRAGISTVQILSIGLGLTVLTLLTLIRTDLLANWRAKLPADTPNYFLINIQPEEVDQLRAFIHQRTGIKVATKPMIRGRLLTINDTPVSADDYDDARAKRLVNRVFNLSIAAELQADNRLVAGQWWGETDEHLFSFEEGFAESLRLKIGDKLSFTIGGKEVSGTVHNLRWVDWDTFNVNFFAVANPGTLDGLAGTHITSVYLDVADKPLLVELLAAYPSVTVFDVDAILTQVRTIMNQVIHAIEFVFAFTLLAGFIVLLAALQSTHDERRYESALLAVLGGSKTYILGSSVIEFALLGLIAGVIAAFAAIGLEWLLAEYIFKISITPDFRAALIVPLLSMGIVILGGLSGMRSVLSVPPIVTISRR